MVVKETLFKGKTFEEWKTVDIREFAKHITSRERRSIVRQAEKIEKFLKKSEKKLSKNKAIRTHEREMIIVPKMLGWEIQVHNGKEFIPVKITEEMLNHRLGEFALTRKKVEHSAPGIGATRSSSFLSVK
jgi:small subunit ribosomal protein S19